MKLNGLRTLNMSEALEKIQKLVEEERGGLRKGGRRKPLVHELGDVLGRTKGMTYLREQDVAKFGPCVDELRKLTPAAFGRLLDNLLEAEGPELANEIFRWPLGHFMHSSSGDGTMRFQIPNKPNARDYELTPGSQYNLKGSDGNVGYDYWFYLTRQGKPWQKEVEKFMATSEGVLEAVAVTDYRKFLRKTIAQPATTEVMETDVDLA